MEEQSQTLQCMWCGEVHGARCPTWKSVEFFELSGKIKSIEFFSDAEMPQPKASIDEPDYEKLKPTE